MSDRVSISEVRIDRAPTLLRACGLGSCLAVGIYDPGTGLGGLGHMLLPARPEKMAGTDLKYVDSGIRSMVDDLVSLGARRETMLAKIAGGANMFERTDLTLINRIGARNAMSARKTLSVLGIPLLAEDVGGNRGRTVEFDLATGIMMVYCARNDERKTF